MLMYAGVNQPRDGKYSIFFVNAPMNETRDLQFQWFNTHDYNLTKTGEQVKAGCRGDRPQ